MRPPTKSGPDVVVGLFWQMFDSGHHLCGFLCYNIFCGFGSENPPKPPRGCICPLVSMVNGQADGGRAAKQPASIAPGDIDLPPSAQIVEKVDSTGTSKPDASDTSDSIFNAVQVSQDAAFTGQVLSYPSMCF